VIGEPYADADGDGVPADVPAARLVFTGGKEALAASHDRARQPWPRLGGLHRGPLRHGQRRDNRAAVRAVRRNDLDLVGLAVYGPRNFVDKVTKGTRSTRRVRPSAQVGRPGRLGLLAESTTRLTRPRILARRGLTGGRRWNLPRRRPLHRHPRSSASRWNCGRSAWPPPAAGRRRSWRRSPPCSWP